MEKIGKTSRSVRQELFAAGCFLAPSLIGFAAFYLIPFLQSIGLSLMAQEDGGGLTLRYYAEVLGSSSFQKAAANTLWFTAISVPLLSCASLGLALLLNRRVFIRKWLRAGFVLPLVVPAASIVLVWQLLFDWNGAINAVMAGHGYPRTDWLKSDFARLAAISIYVWKYVGYNVVLFLAGLQNIPQSYYEIADLEGAGPVRKLFVITLTYLTPTTFLVLLMSILNSFKAFRETYLIAGAYPHDSIYMTQHYMNNMFLSLDVQKLSAAAALTATGVFALAVLFLRTERRFRSYME
ncbi:carbohydrate ABC transporter permease [Paenibacillus macerans]|uniref:carbohydrate ABC transporter permease n=1 Tax=Paenibacillus macerans TaxID=44252 RepID=UPI003D3190DD